MYGIIHTHKGSQSRRKRKICEWVRDWKQLWSGVHARGGFTLLSRVHRSWKVHYMFDILAGFHRLWRCCTGPYGSVIRSPCMQTVKPNWLTTTNENHPTECNISQTNSGQFFRSETKTKPKINWSTNKWEMKKRREAEEQQQQQQYKNHIESQQ